MYIDKKSPIPVYYQLKKIILAKIENGEFDTDHPIPSERDFGEILGISRMTVRQALSQLVNEGVLYREKGKGTFIAKSKIEQRNIMSFSEMVRNKGMVPGTKVLFFECSIPSQDIIDILGLKENDPVYNIRRLRLANEIPIGIEAVFIPEKFCPNLERFDLTASLYQIIREEYSLTINYMDNIIEASRPFKEEKELLAVPANTPVIRISGKSFTDSGVNLLYEQSVYRADEYKYNVRISVNNDIY